MSNTASTKTKDIISERGYSVQKVDVKDKDGKDCYAVLLMKKGDVEKFEQDYKQGSVELSNYGQVLFTGYGNEVPDFEKLFLDSMFGKE